MFTDSACMFVVKAAEPPKLGSLRPTHWGKSWGRRSRVWVGWGQPGAFQLPSCPELDLVGSQDGAEGSPGREGHEMNLQGGRGGWGLGAPPLGNSGLGEGIAQTLPRPRGSCLPFLPPPSLALITEFGGSFAESGVAVSLLPCSDPHCHVSS